jgi:hypothetical protein
MKKHRKKPVVIEAVQFTGNNVDEILEFAKDSFNNPSTSEIVIPTLEGNMMVSIGDYVIKGVNGEFYPCKPDIFDKTYEEVVE